MAEFSPTSQASPVPDCLTVEEAARVLRIGRTAAYGLVRVWRETGGQSGIPYIAFGGSYRVPTGALEAMLGRPITHIPEPGRTKTSATQSASPPREEREASVRQIRPRQVVGRPPAGRGIDQGSLPV